MNSLLLLFLAALLFLLAYFNYGGFLSDIWEINPKKITPSFSKFDRKDFVPTNRSVLIKQHFGTIVGAGAIAGSIQATVFGWVPAYLWIIIGAIFIGGVLDFGSIYVSMRSGGKTLASIIEDNLGEKCGMIFSFISLIVIVLLTSAFVSIISSSFENVPGAATALLFFILAAAVCEFLVSKINLNINIATVICLCIIFAGIFIGYKFPYIKLNKEIWYVVFLLYALITLFVPEWTSEPGNYLNSFVIGALLIISIAGIVISRPYTQIRPINVQPVKSSAGIIYLFPMVFAVTACGAVSGFHSLVSSNITAKKIENEKDVRSISYGSMLIEGIVSIVSMIVVVCIANEDKISVNFNSAPLERFSFGLSNLLGDIKVPKDVIYVFAIFAFSGLALGGINSAVNLIKHIAHINFENKETNKINIKRYLIIIVPILISVVFLNFEYYKIWIMFGISNEILAVLSLTAILMWLVKDKKNPWPAVIPLCLMIFISIASCIAIGFNFIISGDYFLLIVIISFLTAFYPVILGIKYVVQTVKKQNRNIISTLKNK